MHLNITHRILTQDRTGRVKTPEICTPKDIKKKTAKMKHDGKQKK
jgi:hypothetical protein